MEETTSKESLNFIEQIIEDDLKTGKRDRVHTRFPPEPNGYLHIGHAKSICLNFGVAQKYQGLTNLRFDDTNPSAENIEYVESIKKDVAWLGFDWEERLFHASDYFDQLYAYAKRLIETGNAYVCDLTLEEFRECRGVPTSPGKPSPYRDRSVDENLDLFERMKNGEFPEGTKVLRAKIDMSSPNMHMRDPALYRVKKAHHYRTGNAWNIYPMYDFAHALSDSLEGITHSLCTLEFEVHRPLYNWVVEALEVHAPQQIEFARLNLSYTVMSKRKLLKLVESGVVDSWDDPRMPTISGLRRRGYTPEAIRHFATRIGVAKRDGMIDVALLEHSVRDHLNKVAPRFMGVLDPLKVVITNYPEGQTEWLDAVNNPEDESAGMRSVPFSREIYIERDDFMEDAPRKFFRLTVGKEVRLRWAYYITCQEVIKDEQGKIIELRCTYDPETKGGQSPDNRKVKGTMHWVSAEHAKTAEVRLYDRLFTIEDPANDKEKDYTEFLNSDALRVLDNCKVEPALAEISKDARVQFERKGYFCLDTDSTEEHLVFNRTVSLRDTWAKVNKKK